MLFNSLEFAVFLPIVFLLYWFVFQRDIRLQNFFLLVASYFFYGWWDWRFLSLIAFSSLVDFIVGIQMVKSDKGFQRKLLLATSILVNIGFLGFFKYFNFFAESFAEAFTLLGTPIEASRLNILLPVGISFYTFQTLSYSIDIYRGKLKPTRDIIAFFSFVSFFPQLVAGPIERASNLLPQFYKARSFNYGQAVDGLRQILWGLFKKIVIADNCAFFVNYIFESPESYPGSTLLLGVLLFSFQIYGDFSGYSDIAIGTARLFGFDLMRNFAFPYFSRDIAEFWRRWHISLSTWFRDYLYIPLGGSKGSTWQKVRNIFIVFIISGFWHGANWTFIVWGALHAIFFIPLLIINRHRRHLDVVANEKYWPTARDVVSIVGTFILVSVAWIFFRSEDLWAAIVYLSGLLSYSLFSFPELRGYRIGFILVFNLIFLIIIEWKGRRWQHALENLGVGWSRFNRWLFYYATCMLIFLFGPKPQEFIYFQF